MSRVETEESSEDDDHRPKDKTIERHYVRDRQSTSSHSASHEIHNRASYTPRSNLIIDKRLRIRKLYTDDKKKRSMNYKGSEGSVKIANDVIFTKILLSPH